MNAQITPQLLEKVELCVRESATLLQPQSLIIDAKSDRNYVTNIDKAISDYFLQKLPLLLSGSRVVSEEESGEPLDDGLCWIVDPIDGTSNMIFGLPLYTISVGLFDNKKPVLGIVYNPNDKELFSALQGHGATLNGNRISTNKDATLAQTLLLAETNPYANRTQTRTREIISRAFLECVDYRVLGSAALDICYVACGRAGAFFTEHVSPWDCAGGLSILLEAGGKATDWTGNDFDFISGGTFLASNGLLHTETMSLFT